MQLVQRCIECVAVLKLATAADQNTHHVCHLQHCSVPRAIFLGHGEPAADRSASVVVVVELVGGGCDASNDVGTGWVDRDGAADDEAGSAQQVLDGIGPRIGKEARKGSVKGDDGIG